MKFYIGKPDTNFYVGSAGFQLFGKWIVSRESRVDTIDLFPYNGEEIRNRYICVTGYVHLWYEVFGLTVYKSTKYIGRDYGDNPGQFTKDEFGESLNIELPEFRR